MPYFFSCLSIDFVLTLVCQSMYKHRHIRLQPRFRYNVGCSCICTGRYIN